MLEASSNRKKYEVTCKKWARSQMRYVTGGTATEDYIGHGTEFKFC